MNDDRAKYPHLYPPKGFSPIDRNGVLAVQNVTANPISTVLETITEVGGGSEGWIRLIALESGDFNNTSYAILEDGAPMKNYVYIKAPVGAVSTPRSCFIRLIAGRRYDLVGTIKANHPGFISLRWTLFGWYYAIPQG